MDRPAYGEGDASFQAAGQQEGIRALVDAFYDKMGTDPRFETIYAMHPDDIEESRDRLARFLCGWLGGPSLYNEKYGTIRIPSAHSHLQITSVERDQWLNCMSESVAQQPFSASFKVYLMEQLYVPAEGVRRKCEGLQKL